jgi:3-methylfumaryl-CoA hydratase
LIVHGPLIATLLLDLLRRQMPTAQLQRFSFKAMKPIFDIAPFTVCGRIENDQTVRLWAVTPDGYLAMDATAEIA